MSHKIYRKESNCLNCGAQVNGKFCSNCGQENLETHENFFHLAGHFIADYFHYDSKFFRSLVPLFTKPGFLTKEYWEGRRVHYIHPLRLFFFITIGFIIATTLFYNRFGEQLKDSLIKTNTGLGKLDTATVSKMQPTDKILYKNDSITVQKWRELRTDDIRMFNKFKSGMDHVFINLKYVTFFLLPLYALVFKILYRKQRPFFVDHLVFAMHLQCFAYFVLGLLLMLPFFTPVSILSLREIAFFILLIYTAFAFHRLYHQKIWKSVLKSFLAMVTIFFMTIMAVVAVALVDAIFVQ